MHAVISAAVCLALGLGGGDADNRSTGRGLPSLPRAAATLPHFEARDLTGQRWTAADLQGRVVLLDFWATWCAPCLADLPHLKALRARHDRADFEIVGISLDVRSRRSFVSWLNRHRIEWPQIHDRAGYNGALPRTFGVDSLPRTILVGRDGRIVASGVRGEELAVLVDSLVRANAPPGEQQ